MYQDNLNSAARDGRSINQQNMATIISDKNRVIIDSNEDIEGWGFDADPNNKPNYPIKRYTGADHERLNYKRSAQQPETVEVLHSNERPSITTVFGTSSPPFGWSGKLRRYAFKFSEGSSGHWLTLMLADRVNVIEGIVDDLRHGHIPNFFAEKGWKAEWKYNRAAAVKKIATTVAITSALVTFFILRNKRRAVR